MHTPDKFVSLHAEDLAFIEKFGIYGAHAGMPLSVARVFAFLLVCDPPQQTAKTIRDTLGLSAGSVSIATKMLVQLGLVTKISITGTAGVHYVVEPQNFKKVIEHRVRAHAEAEKIAREALASGRPNPRLTAMEQTYGRAAIELQTLLEKLELPSED